MVYFEKKLYNGNNIPLIPLLLINHKLVLDFRESVNHFNEFLQSQCTIILNNSTLSHSTHVSNVWLSFINFEDKKIFKIIRSANVHEAYSCDNISTRFLKAFDSSLVKSMSMTFRKCLRLVLFLALERNQTQSLSIRKKGS